MAKFSTFWSIYTLSSPRRPAAYSRGNGGEHTSLNHFICLFDMEPHPQDLSQQTPTSFSSKSDFEILPVFCASHRSALRCEIFATDSDDGVVQKDLLEALSVVSRRSLPPQTRMRQLRQLLRRRPGASRFFTVRPDRLTRLNTPRTVNWKEGSVSSSVLPPILFTDLPLGYSSAMRR